jgi:hypothetical protein
MQHRRWWDRVIGVDVVPILGKIVFVQQKAGFRVHGISPFSVLVSR